MGMLASAARVRNRARDGTGCSAIGPPIMRELRTVALLATLASVFKLATPPYEFQFPRDHGSHPEYRTEWWYYTGHLRTAVGRRYGYEVTFFRAGVSREERGSAWDLGDLMPAHFAITDVEQKDFRFYEKLNRASVFTADAAEGKLDVFNEAWRATTNPDGSWRLVAKQGTDSLDLVL